MEAQELAAGTLGGPSPPGESGDPNSHLDPHGGMGLNGGLEGPEEDSSDPHESLVIDTEEEEEDKE